MPVEHDTRPSYEDLESALRLENAYGRDMKAAKDAYLAALAKIVASKDAEGFHTRQAQALQKIAADALGAVKPESTEGVKP